MNNKPIYTDKPSHGAFYHLQEMRPAVPEGPSQYGWKPFFVTLNNGDGSKVTALWSVNPDNGFEAPPKIGEKVRIMFNNFGTGTVRGYFVEAGFLGVEIECDERPAWHVKQDPENKHPHPLVFGAEIRRPVVEGHNHTTEEVDPKDRTSSNYCPACKGWFRPAAQPQQRLVEVKPDPATLAEALRHVR